MANMTHNSTANRWELLHTINQAYPSTPKEFVLNTENKFLDQNIYVGITVPNHVGTFTNQSIVTGGSAVANNLTYTSGMNVINSPSGTEGINYWEITGTATGNAGSFTPKYNVTTAGWIVAQAYTGSATSVNVSSDSTGKSIYIPAAVATVSGSKAAATPSITAGATVSGKTQLTFSLDTNTNNISTYYVTLKAIAGATTFANSNMTYSVGTKGYLNAGNQISLSSLATTASNKQYYLPVPSAVIAAGGSTANVTINDTDSSAQGINIQGVITHTADTSEPSSGYYFAVDYSGSGYSSVSTAGWVPTGALSASGTSFTSGTKYFKVGAATPSASYANTYINTYFTSGTSSDYDMSITPKYAVGVAGYIPATTGVSGTTDYWKIKDTSVSTGTTTVNGETATRGSVAWGTGWITSGSIGAATFSNSATSGVVYTDISDTTAAPILISNSYLYINEGYTDNLRISLAKLVPNGASAQLAAGHILSGYSAYNNDGTLIAGSIPTRTASNISFSGKTVTVTAGYYASNTTKNMGLATIKSGAATISSASYTYNSTNDNFTVSGSATVAAPTAPTAGYISSSEGTKQTNTATLTATVAKVGLGVTLTGNATVEPVISKITTASGGNAVNISADTGTIVAGTVPSNGYYVAVQSAAASNTITAAPKVTTNGYGTTSNYGATNDTLDVGAIASKVTYLPINAAVGSVTMTAGAGSCTYNSGTNITVADNDTDYNSGVSVKFNGSGSVTATAKITKAGYSPINNNFATGSSTASNSASLIKYIKGVTLTAPSSGTRQFDITVPNGTTETITFHFHVDSESNVYID